MLKNHPCPFAVLALSALRYELGEEFTGFSGTMRLDKNPPPGALSNRRTLSGAGVGVNWTISNSFVMKAYYARNAWRRQLSGDASDFVPSQNSVITPTANPYRTSEKLTRKLNALRRIPVCV